VTSAKGNAIGVAQVAFQLLQIAQQNPAAAQQAGMKGLITEVVAATKAEVEGAEKQIQPLMLDVIAHLQEATGDLDAAIASQEAAVAAADERTKARLSAYLEELKAAKNPPASEEADKK
jgi:hypothetical protein